MKSPNGELLGVVHRDISPQNLFVTLDGIVKVLDFGIAKVQDQSVRTTTGAVKGTYCYMSPEQLRGEKVDRRADVWAIGAVLWESLAQRHLFKRETEFLTFQAITQEAIPDICELRPDVPPAIGEVLSRAISRDREQRYPTARALGEALAQAVAQLGGVLGAAAISEEIERAFDSLLDEQRSLLDMAREGDTFDLERSHPLVGRGAQLGNTPVSNIQGKLREAQAEVEHYVRAQQAIEAIEDDASGVGRKTPPPQRRSRPLPTVTAPHDEAQTEYQRPATVIAPASRLPWIIALVAVGVAGAAAAMLYMSRAQTSVPPPTPTVAVATPPPEIAKPAVVVPIDASVVAVAPIDATIPTEPTAPTVPTVVPHDAGIAAVDPVTRPHKPASVVAPPPQVVPSGPPGFITIDSTPVYAVIFIDGKKYGETPLVHISVPAGKHSVRAVSSSGSTRNISITIESGKTAPVRRIEW